MSKQMIVIRQLPQNAPALSYVVNYDDIPKDRDVPDDYARELCHEHIEKFKEKFHDFKAATFYIQIVRIAGGECQHYGLEII